MPPHTAPCRRLTPLEIEHLKGLFGHREGGTWSEGTIERLRDAVSEAEAVLHLEHAGHLWELTDLHARYIETHFQSRES